MLHIDRRGVYRLPGINAINTAADKKKAAEVSDKQNTAKYLQDQFVLNHKDTLHEERLEVDGRLYMVKVMKPTAAYTEHGLLVVAADLTLLNSDATANIPTQVIYDYPPVVQETYWRLVVAAMQSAPEGAKVCAGENCISTRTSEHHRTSRSIALPHTHSMYILLDQIQEERVNFVHLSLEQELLRENLPSILDMYKKQFAPHLNALVGKQLTFHPDKTPVGYSFTLKTRLTSEQSMKQAIHELTTFLATNHAFYSKIGSEIFQYLVEKYPKRMSQRKHKFIPQPSYRLYLHVNPEGLLEGIISPELISFAGVMEAAGLKLIRDPEAPRRVAEHELQAFHEEVRVNIVGNEGLVVPVRERRKRVRG